MGHVYTATMPTVELRCVRVGQFTINTAGAIATIRRIDLRSLCKPTLRARDVDRQRKCQRLKLLRAARLIVATMAPKWGYAAIIHVEPMYQYALVQSITA